MKRSRKMSSRQWKGVKQHGIQPERKKRGPVVVHADEVELHRDLTLGTGILPGLPGGPPWWHGRRS